MQSAERNIEDRLEELQGTFHQLRQSAITEELRDVVAGFETLRKHNNASSPGV
jgi:F-type H+-transporting ATPase subunit gamma